MKFYDRRKLANKVLVCLKKELKEVIKTDKLAGLSFCMSGASSSGRTKDDIKDDIEANGGIVEVLVKKGLTYLISEVKDTLKVKKAIRYGIKVINENELMGMIKEEK